MINDIVIVCVDDHFANDLRDLLNINSSNMITFQNKYFTAEVPVLFTSNPSDVIGCLAIVVVDRPGTNTSNFFAAADSAEIKILISIDEKKITWCVENNVELLVWSEEDGQQPEQRLRSSLECYEWQPNQAPCLEQDTEETTHTPEIENEQYLHDSFEHLMQEMKKIRELRMSGNVNEEELKSMAADAASKLMLLLDENDDE